MFFRSRYLAKLTGAALFLAFATAARPGLALERAATANRAQFSGGPRIGTDNLNFGLGGRGGYTLDQNIYLGGSLDYFFGESSNYAVGGARQSVSVRFWALSFEGGYDFGINDRLVIRPFAGLGIAGIIGESCGPSLCTSASSTDAVFTLGGVLHYFVTEQLYIGPDLRFLIMDNDAFVAGGHFGAVF